MTITTDISFEYDTPPKLPPEEMSGIARAAMIIAVGNVASRVLGLVRDTTKSYFFGASGMVSAFNIAAKVPMWFYELLAGGMVSAALVPVFSEYAKPEKRAELWQIVSFLLTLTAAGLAVLTLLGEMLAPQITWLIGGGLSPQALELSASLLHLTLPAMIFLNLAGVMAGVLYALQRFTLPAFNAAIFNLGIVLTTVFFARKFGVHAMAGGLLLGAILQVLLQLPGLRDARLRPVFNWAHPAVRRIARLYFPIVLGLVVDMISRAISYRLASGTGDESIAWMEYATTLMQFPLGLTSAAISVAILPTLARQAAARDLPLSDYEFLATLSKGLRLVLVLIIPATIGLFLLANPVVKLIFEHGDFRPRDTIMTTLVLRLYLLGLIAAAVDLPLVHAFYARQDAWTPAVVGLIGVFIYLAVALAPSFFRPMQLTDLIIATSVQLTTHMLIMLGLLRYRVGSLNGYGLGSTACKATLASAVMAVLTVGSLYGTSIVTWHTTFMGELAAVILPGLIGAVTYLGLMSQMGVPEITRLLSRFRLAADKLT